MNNGSYSGRILHHAVVYQNEEGQKELRFKLATRCEYDFEQKLDIIEFPRCMMARPSEKMERLLTTKGKGMLVEFEGRVGNSRFRDRNGEKVEITEVKIRKKTFRLSSKL